MDSVIIVVGVVLFFLLGCGFVVQLVPHEGQCPQGRVGRISVDVLKMYIDEKTIPYAYFYV